MEFEFAWELTARFDSRASFYRKAMVKLFKHNGKECYKLYSYETLVMVIENDKSYRMEDDDLYSYTTTRHCREFVRQFADIKKKLTKKRLVKITCMECIKKIKLSKG